VYSRREPVKSRIIIRTFLIMCLSIFITGIIACEHAVPIIVKNQTDITLTIYVTYPSVTLPGKSVGQIKPGEEIKNTRLLDVINEYKIIAEDSSGKIVFLQIYDREILKAMGWTVVIKTEDLVKAGVST
jgi:hypothetical protein